MMWYGNYGLGMGYGYGLFGMMFSFIWWALIILALVSFIKWAKDGKFSSNGKDALDILKERYAKGEISKAEFEEKKKDILAN